jgi:Rha family phage regulatory protein
MYDLTIIEQGDGVYIDSREVAELIGKQHGHLLRDIRGYAYILEKNGLSKIGLSDFFVESSYLNAQNKEMPCYLISRKGADIIANKTTGEKGLLFTAAYVTRFHEMETAELTQLAAEIAELSNGYELLSKILSEPPIQLPRLGEFNACARIVVRSLRDMGATAEQVLKFLKGVYEPLGIAVAEDDEFENVPQMYTAKQIAKKLGIYSVNGNPHYQAVSCILNENIFIGDSHKSVLTNDYGTHIGISVRYDDYAVQSVRDWLSEYACPAEIYGFERTYYVLYQD